MIIYTSDFTGTAYALDEGALLCTPMYEDCTFDTCIDNWVEVDFDSLEQGSDVKVHVEWVRGHLRVMEEGIFADPTKM